MRLAAKECGFEMNHEMRWIMAPVTPVWWTAINP